VRSDGAEDADDKENHAQRDKEPEVKVTTLDPPSNDLVGCRPSESEVSLDPCITQPGDVECQDQAGHEKSGSDGDRQHKVRVSPLRLTWAWLNGTSG